jgi:hypothetical protein
MSVKYRKTPKTESEFNGTREETCTKPTALPNSRHGHGNRAVSNGQNRLIDCRMLGPRAIEVRQSTETREGHPKGCEQLSVIALTGH